MVFDNILKNAIEISKKTLACSFEKHSIFFFHIHMLLINYISLKYLIIFP